MAWMMSPFYTAYDITDYWLAFATIALTAGVSFILLLALARFTIKIITRINYRSVSIFALAVVLLMIGGMVGMRGLFIMTVASGIGLIPVLFHSRRMNCMGVLLIPITLNMMGLGPAVLRLLRLA